jgi:integrase
MPRPINKLNARQVATAKKPGRYSDGGGLYLVIDDNRRRWVFRYTRRGTTTELGLGSARDVSLSEAREAAEALRRVLRSGEDPRAARLKPTVPNFGEFADKYVEAMRDSWRSAVHAGQWQTTLAEYAAPLRDKPIDEITTADVLEVLQPIWARIPETAQRLRGRIESILDAAKAKDLRSGENPARWRGHLNNLLPARKKLDRGHHEALRYGEVPEFIARLRERQTISAQALEFTILTAARTSEILGARWSEIDLVEGIWTVPAVRMKAGREHRVPLSPRAMQILSAVKAITPLVDGYLFPSAKPARPLSSKVMSKLLSGMGVKATVHGFRSSFRDWASELTGFAHQTVEQALAHAISNQTEAAYRRGDQLAKRRDLMNAWQSFCESGGVVIPFRQIG